MFLAGNANWLSELASVIKNYYNTLHSSIEVTPNQAREKTNEKLVYSNLHDLRAKQKSKFQLG